MGGPGLPPPPGYAYAPVPVTTQWAIWLRAALCCSENLPAFRTIINKWTGEGLSVGRAKEATNVDGLVPDLVRINQYQTLALTSRC